MVLFPDSNLRLVCRDRLFQGAVSLPPSHPISSPASFKLMTWTVPESARTVPHLTRCRFVFLSLMFRVVTIGVNPRRPINSIIVISASVSAEVMSLRRFSTPAKGSFAGRPSLRLGPSGPPSRRCCATGFECSLDRAFPRCLWRWSFSSCL